MLCIYLCVCVCVCCVYKSNVRRNWRRNHSSFALGRVGRPAITSWMVLLLRPIYLAPLLYRSWYPHNNNSSNNDSTVYPNLHAHAYLYTHFLMFVYRSSYSSRAQPHHSGFAALALAPAPVPAPAPPPPPPALLPPEQTAKCWIVGASISRFDCISFSSVAFDVADPFAAASVRPITACIVAATFSAATCGADGVSRIQAKNKAAKRSPVPVYAPSNCGTFNTKVYPPPSLLPPPLLPLLLLSPLVPT